MTKHIVTRALLFTIVATLAGCAAMREGMEGHKDAVAVADGYKLTIDQVAQLSSLAPDSILPAEPGIIDRVTSIWVGFTVLAVDLQRDRMFSSFNVDPLTRFGRQQDLAWQLREDVLARRSAPDDSTLREMYMRDQPFTRVLAHHILIRVPEDADDAQVDSLRQLAESLRQRILAGEPFDELARRYSEDPSSAAAGGELGWVTRGRLVPELDAIIFDLPTDEISDVVRTTFGFHIVKVTDREVPEFESVSDTYRQRLANRDIASLEDSYVDSLTEAADMRIAPGAVNLVRRNAFSSRLTRLGAAERSRVLVRYRGGELTLGEWADFLIHGAPNTQAALAGADSTGTAQMLERLTMNEVLAQESERVGHSLSQQVADSLDAAARTNLRATALGWFRSFAPLEGDPVTSRVNQAFQWLLVRRRGSQSLDRMLPAIYRSRPALLIHPYRFKQAAELLQELRAEQAAAAGATASSREPVPGS